MASPDSPEDAESSPRFMLWRRSAADLFGCERRLHLLNCTDLMLKASVISSAVIAAPPVSFPLGYNVDPWMTL